MLGCVTNMTTKLLLLSLPLVLSAQLSTQIDWNTQIKNKPLITASETIWHRTNGMGGSGNLSASGAGKIITLTPGPKGITTSTPLRISGGTGTPEIVTPSATTCLAATTSLNCTVTVTTSQTHTGAWVVGSATSGIKECLESLPSTPTSGGVCWLVRGSWPIYAPIVISKNGSYLLGENRIATILEAQSGISGPVISIPSALDVVVISNLQINNTGSNYAISAVNQSHLLLRDLAMNSANGFSCTGSTNTQFNLIQNVFINSVTGTGVFVSSAPEACGTFENVRIGGDGTTAGSKGFHIQSGVGGWLTRTYTLGLAEGLLINPGNGQTVGVIDLDHAYFDGYGTNSVNGIHISATGTGAANIIRSINSATNGFDYGVVFDGNGVNDGFLFTQHKSIGNDVNGFYLVNLLNSIFRDCVATANSLSAPNSFDGLYAEEAGGGTIDRIKILGGFYAQAFNYGVSGGQDTQRLGIAIAANVSNIEVIGATVSPNLTGSISNGSTTATFLNNPGYNPVGPADITVTASPMTYTSGASPEMVYIKGGTVSEVARGSIVVCAASPCQTFLPPNTAIVVTYSSAPTMAKDIH